MEAAKPRPTEITRLPELPGLRVTWSDGHVSVFPGRDLRLACACANCVNEWTGAGMLDPSRVPERVAAEAIDLMGHYGIRIHWSDGHDTGIYTYGRLRALCPCEACAASGEGA